MLHNISDSGASYIIADNTKEKSKRKKKKCPSDNTQQQRLLRKKKEKTTVMKMTVNCVKPARFLTQFFSPDISV
jgi:hypothetical protein